MEEFRLGTEDCVEFIYTSDWHLAMRPPGRRTASYARDILDKIRFVLNLTNEKGAVALCGGDVFHVKDPNSESNSYALVNTLTSVLKTAPYGKVFGDHGNHDLLADRVESIPTQPIGNLIASGVYHDLSAEPLIFVSANGKVSVAIEAYPYADDMVTLQKVLAAPPRPTTYCGECSGAGCEGCSHIGKVAVGYRIAILHQYGHPGNQGTMYGNHPTIGYNQLADSDYDIILWGHDHSREETITVGNVTHIRLGSLARAAWSGDEKERKVSAAGLKFTASGVKYKEIPIPVKPLSTIFVTADIVTSKIVDSHEVTSFFDVMDASVAEVENNDAGAVVHSLCLNDKPVEDKVRELCQGL